MATPQDLLVKAKSRMAQQGGGSQPNPGGSRGAPARGGMAARPATGNGIQARPGRPRPMYPRPGAEPAIEKPATITSPDGAASMRRPGFGSPLGAPQEPAWKQLQAAGIGGQGTAAANRAKLAEMQMGSGGIIAPDQVPGAAPDMPVGSPGGAPTINSFPGFKPRPGAEPQLMTGGGLMAGPRPQGRMPIANIMDLDGPEPGGPGGGLGAGGGFGDIAAVAAPFAAGMNRPGGANLANRFSPPRSMPTYNPLR